MQSEAETNDQEVNYISSPFPPGNQPTAAIGQPATAFIGQSVTAFNGQSAPASIPQPATTAIPERTTASISQMFARKTACAEISRVDNRCSCGSNSDRKCFYPLLLNRFLMLSHVTGVLQAIADALQNLHFSIEHVKSTQREHGHLIDRLIAQSAPAQEKKNRWKCKLPLTTVKQFVDFEKEVENKQKKADMVGEVRQHFLFFHSILVIHRLKSLVWWEEPALPTV